MKYTKLRRASLLATSPAGRIARGAEVRPRLLRATELLSLAGVIRFLLILTGGLFSSQIVRSEVGITFERNDNNQARPSFTFKNIPAPVRTEIGAHAKLILIEGEPDPNGGGLEVLNDGHLPQEPDDPSENFFFKAGTAGGRLLVDLGQSTDLAEVNTYSWQPGTRGPQKYALFSIEKTTLDPNEYPKKGSNPVEAGWKLLARVDTATNHDSIGGQYGVHIFDTKGILGKFRYLLLDILPTENTDAFGNTFYSEIVLVGANGAKIEATQTVDACRAIVDADHGAGRITVDTCDTPDLTEWSRKELSPVVSYWYPKIVELLPSEGFEAPKEVTVRFSSSLKGVAETSGTRIRCAGEWFRANLKGEAAGAVVHELVHVVQQYGTARRNNPEATRSPGWLVEGLADYVRWFLYEPQSHGADLVWMRQRKNLQLRHDAGYRVTANFLNWVTEKYDKSIVQSLNAAMREGKYRDEIWKTRTGHALQDLGSEWKKDLEHQLAPTAAPDGARARVRSRSHLAL